MTESFAWDAPMEHLTDLLKAKAKAKMSAYLKARAKAKLTDLLKAMAKAKMSGLLKAALLESHSQMKEWVRDSHFP